MSKGLKCFPRRFVPQTLKHLLKAVTLENLISHRSLLHEGKLVLTGARRWWNRFTFCKLRAPKDRKILTLCLFWSTPREHKADRRLPIPVRRIPADHKDKEKQEGTACRRRFELPHVEYSVVRNPLCDLRPQKAVGPEQNPLRLPQNQELDQFLKEGCTFTVLDQPLSLDRLQLKNIDQLNASSNKRLLVPS